MAIGEPYSVWNVGAELGEGPVWVERDSALWFVDIKQRKIHRFEPATGERRSWVAPEQIGFLLPAANSGFIAGMQTGLYRFDESDGSFARLVAVEAERPDNRLNDGVVDPDGRLWFGTMDDGERARSGSFYRFARGKVAPTGLDGVAITNGPAVSPDGRTLYTVDTLGGTISQSAIDSKGQLRATRSFVRIPAAEGHPDGPTVDSEGCLWIALFGGSEVRRYSPAGEIVGRVRFPVTNITKIAFGGPDLTTAYATTARLHLGPMQRELQPQAGNLFAFEVDVPGLQCPLVEMDTGNAAK